MTESGPPSLTPSGEPEPGLREVWEDARDFVDGNKAKTGRSTVARVNGRLGQTAAKTYRALFRAFMEHGVMEIAPDSGYSPSQDDRDSGKFVATEVLGWIRSYGDRLTTDDVRRLLTWHRRWSAAPSPVSVRKQRSTNDHSAGRPVSPLAPAAPALTPHERALLTAARSVASWQWAHVPKPHDLFLSLQRAAEEGVGRLQAEPLAEPWTTSEVAGWLHQHTGADHAFWRRVADFAGAHLAYQEAGIGALLFMRTDMDKVGLPYNPKSDPVAGSHGFPTPRGCNLSFFIDVMEWIEDQHAGGSLTWGPLRLPELTVDGIFGRRHVATPPIAEATVSAVNAMVKIWLTAPAILEVLQCYDGLPSLKGSLDEAATALSAADLRRGACSACTKAAPKASLSIDPALRDTLRQQHHARLMELVEQFRSFVDDPHLELSPYIGPPEWWDDGPRLVTKSGDCTLFPEMWFASVTPDISDPALWGEWFPRLREHLADSPFWAHLDELRAKAEGLRNAYAEAARQLADEDPDLAGLWEDEVRRMTFLPAPDRTPAFASTEDEPIDEEAERESRRFARRVLAKFAKHIPNLPGRFHALYAGLAQLRDDLLPERVDALMARTRCDLCQDW